MKDPIRNLLVPVFSSLLIVLTIYWGMNGIVNLFFEYEPPPPRQNGPLPSKEYNFITEGALVRITDHPRWASRLNVVGAEAVEATVYGSWKPKNAACLHRGKSLAWNLQQAEAAQTEEVTTVFALRIPWTEAYGQPGMKWHGLLFPAPPPTLRPLLEENHSLENPWSSIHHWKSTKVLVIGAELRSNAMELAGLRP